MASSMQSTPSGRHGYTGARWLLTVVAQDLVLLALLVAICLSRPSTPLLLLLGIAIPVVLAWGVITLHFPSGIEIDDHGVTFRGYGRVHHYAWSGVRRVRVRRFVMRDRVLVRITPSSPLAGRYWIVDSIGGFDSLVRALEERASDR